MLAHVYQFREGDFGPTAPWVYALIAFTLCMIVAVNAYLILKKQRARWRRRRERQYPGARVIAPVDRCARGTCPVFNENDPALCPTRIRMQCKEIGLADLNAPSDA